MVGDHVEVKQFMHADFSPDMTCGHCGKLFKYHGFIEQTISDEALVCPGDWVVTRKCGRIEIWPPEAFTGSFKLINRLALEAPEYTH